jgi:cell fate (sporulation/competence/biofilm development) regulator YmcA (YheA/YmcA/DUF963 family)
MRLKSIVLTSLIADRLIAYENLERVMNSDGDVNSTCDDIKKFLKKVVNLNAIIDEWQSITNSDAQNTEIPENINTYNEDE